MFSFVLLDSGLEGLVTMRISETEGEFQSFFAGFWFGRSGQQEALKCEDCVSILFLLDSGLEDCWKFGQKWRVCVSILFLLDSGLEEKVDC